MAQRMVDDDVDGEKDSEEEFLRGKDDGNC